MNTAAAAPAMVAKVAAANSKSKAALVTVTVGPVAPQGAAAASRPDVPEGGDLRARQDSARDAIKALKMAWKVRLASAPPRTSHSSSRPHPASRSQAALHNLCTARHSLCFAAASLTAASAVES